MIPTRCERTGAGPRSSASRVSIDDYSETRKHQRNSYDNDRRRKEEENREAGQVYTDHEYPLWKAKLEKLRLQLDPVPQQERGYYDKRNARREELERQLRLVVAEAQEQTHLIS